jgi:hypothetical protein
MKAVAVLARQNPCSSGQYCEADDCIYGHHVSTSYSLNSNNKFKAYSTAYSHLKLFSVLASETASASTPFASFQRRLTLQEPSTRMLSSMPIRSVGGRKPDVIRSECLLYQTHGGVKAT